MLEKTLTGSARKGTFSPEEIKEYKNAWSQPGALTGMLNWYRASRFNQHHYRETSAVPTLLLWGKKDKYLKEEMALPSIEKCTNGQLIFLKEATHWLHHEEPDRVNRLIVNFIETN